METKIQTSNINLDTFRKGFMSYRDLDQYEDMIVFTVGGGMVGSSVDDARKRISELGLPLTAKITSYKNFVVELVK